MQSLAVDLDMELAICAHLAAGRAVRWLAGVSG